MATSYFLYEISNLGQYVGEDGELIVKGIDSVTEAFDQRVHEIVEGAWADKPPLLFFTSSETIWRMVNRKKKALGLPLVEFKPNFRIALATVKPYKGHRATEKPYHFENLMAYALNNYECVVANGMEADDMLSIYQRSLEETIICSRDKDLRIVPGEHYGWEVSNQPSFGPKEISEEGYLELKGKKLSGGGLKFFYAQCLMGDPTDNIPGLPKVGPAKAFKALEEVSGELEMYAVVKSMYEEKYAENWREALLEQARLLWMVNEINEDGSPKMWEPPTN